MVQFRPLPVLSLCMLPALALLITLGVWQSQRMGWKADQVAQYEAMAQAEPLLLSTFLCSNADVTPGQPVDVRADVSRDRLIKVWGRNGAETPGWRLFAPVRSDDCSDQPAILVEVGFETFLEPRQTFYTASTRHRFAPGPQAGTFTPDADLEAQAFYAFDAPLMARSLGLNEDAMSARGWIERDNGSLPAHLAQTPPERHFGYALTWFLMALALIAVYCVFHVSKGRLIFTSKKD